MQPGAGGRSTRLLTVKCGPREGIGMYTRVLAHTEDPKRVARDPIWRPFGTLQASQKLVASIRAPTEESHGTRTRG